MGFGCNSRVDHQRRFHGATDLGSQKNQFSNIHKTLLALMRPFQRLIL